MALSSSKSPSPKNANASEADAMNKTKAPQALHIAQNLARQVRSSVDLHNTFFGLGGNFGELFPTRAKRAAFAKTPEYREILRLRANLAQAVKAVS
jgi:hypothetical protein